MKKGKLLTSTLGISLLVLPACSYAQAYMTNPWSRSLFGSRVWSRIGISSSFNVHPYRGTSTWTDVNGGTVGNGHEWPNAYLQHTVPYRDRSPVYTKGSVDSERISIHAKVYADGQRRWSNPNGTAGIDSHWAEHYVYVWDSVTVHWSNKIQDFIPASFLIHGHTEAGADVGFKYYLGTEPPTGGLAQWKHIDLTGFQGAKNINENLLFPAAEEFQTYFVGFQMRIFAQSHGEDSVLADFGNSAYFQWNLPRGARVVSSGSGRWNAGSITPVPEPTTMFAFVLGGIGLIKRRKGNV